MINVTITLKNSNGSTGKANFYNAIEAYYNTDSECFIVVIVPEDKFYMFPRENVISLKYDSTEEDSFKIISMNGDENNEQ